MEAVTGLAYSRRVVPVTFAERVEWVLVNRRLSQEAWAEAAGLSRRYIATTLLRARKDPEYLPTYETLQRLEEAARVSFQWLAEGKGEPEDTAAPALRVVRSELTPALRALYSAFRHGDFDADDFEALRRVLAEGRQSVVDDEATLVEVMVRWLSAAKRLRLDGVPVTFEGLAWYLTTGGAPAASVAMEQRTAALNQEAERELAALGATPPAEPVLPPVKKR